MIYYLNSIGNTDLPSINGLIVGYLFIIFEISFKFYNPGIIDVISKIIAWVLSVAYEDDKF